MGNPCTAELGLLASRVVPAVPFSHNLPLNTWTTLACLELYMYSKSDRNSEINRWRGSGILSLKAREQSSIFLLNSMLFSLIKEENCEVGASRRRRKKWGHILAYCTPDHLLFVAKARYSHTTEEEAEYTGCIFDFTHWTTGIQTLAPLVLGMGIKSLNIKSQSPHPSNEEDNNWLICSEEISGSVHVKHLVQCLSHSK